MDKIEQINKSRQNAHEKLLKYNSKVYKSFLDMESAAYSDGALLKQTKELIAIGISVAINCESCMQWHIEQAIKDGASEEQILEAIEVGIEMKCGAATVSARFALEVLEATLKNKTI
ncbi:MAG: carboxymuconolactone decarboxylase family protein [Planctomycetota bacterium]|jgi:AhpD family alkylhydroperoxidase